MYRFFCIFLVVVAISKGDDDCPTYFKQITTDYEKCLSSKIDITQVFAKLAEVARGNATVEGYQKTVVSFCNRFLNVPECFDNIIVDKSVCYYDPPIQDFRNAFKSFILLNKLGCANNGKRYLDMVAGDGPTCYSQNEQSDQCFKDSKTKLGIENIQAYQDDFICKIKKADAECLTTYDSCSNQNVKVFLSELNQAVQVAFNCN